MKKVAIVGTAPSGINAPFHDTSWDIWGCGLRAPHVSRASRWYELHRLDGEPLPWAIEWRKAMKEWPQDCPIYMFYPEPDLGAEVVKFDPQPLIAKYGTFFMTSSFSWMIAQAIEEGYTEISLWGVDMEYGTEYVQQRSGLRHFIEVAKLAGVNITRVATSGIAYEPIPYPFWQDDPLLAKLALRLRKSKELKQESELARDGMRVKAERHRGKLELLVELAAERSKDDFDMDAWLDRTTTKQRNYIDGMQSALIDATAQVHKYEGSMEEIQWCEDYLRP